MNKLTIHKQYSDGEVRSIEINETEDNVKHMLSSGYFLTKEEAAKGQVKPAAKPVDNTKQKAKPAARKKAPIKLKA